MVWLLNSEGMKNCKSTESFCLSILTIYTNAWFTFLHSYCCQNLISKIREVWIQPKRTSFFLKKKSWLLWRDFPPRCVPRNQTFSGKLNLSFFKAVPPNRLYFYQGSPLYRINSLFSYLCLFRKAILQKKMWS